MPKFLKYAAVVLLAIALLLGIAVMFMPDSYQVTREITIEADTATIHPFVEDLERWPEWCAWNAERYPSIVNTFSGEEDGVSKVWSWTMDEGPGRMEVTASDREKGVWFDLTFGEPGREMYSKGTIQYEVEEGGTKLIWTNQGRLQGIAKLMGPMLDSMMGADFEAGLSELKIQVEGLEG